MLRLFLTNIFSFPSKVGFERSLSSSFLLFFSGAFLVFLFRPVLLLAAETSGGGRRPGQRSVLLGSVWACFRGSSAGLPGISCGCV